MKLGDPKDPYYSLETLERLVKTAESASALVYGEGKMSPGMKATLKRAKRVLLANTPPATNNVPAMPFPKCIHANPWNDCKTCGTTPKKASK